MKNVSKTKNRYCLIGLIILSSVTFCSIADNTNSSEDKHDTGQFYPFLKSLSEQNQPSLSYTAQCWPNVESWRTQGRAKMQELLAYAPPPTPLNPQIIATQVKRGYTRYHVSYQVCPERRTEAFLLIPNGLKGPAPAVIALHDHGGFYYFGKEKITETENPPKALTDFIDLIYQGRPFADELARRGFVVLVPDAFYFGSQRLQLETLPEIVVDPKKYNLDALKPDSDEYIRIFNKISRNQETVMARTMFVAGTTWPGVFLQGDRAALDYLLTRPEVDPERIGCMGLSGGGFRSLYLFGLDPRIKAAVAAGFMTTYNENVFPFLYAHTWMVYLPHQYRYLDLPDIATLNAPRPLMVVNCSKDNLFSMQGMKDAEEKIKTVYEIMQEPDHFQCRYYNTHHSLLLPAQEDSIAWLEKWLK